MQFLLWALFGVLGAFIIHTINPQGKGGLFAAVFLGILGSLEAGFALTSFNLVSHTNIITNALIALLGGVSLVGIQKVMAKS